ncbi:MAG: TIGR03862 family flavoprotein [Burkholderiales bacterium]
MLPELPRIKSSNVIVIGAGPAGLMAAEVLSKAGATVQVFDAMPSVGRKFLLAGKGGLNLTHSEPAVIFNTHYGTRLAQVAPWLQTFGAAELRAWALGLGIETFIGTSGRVFPIEMKATPLLRAWLQRLRSLGVQFHMRNRWLGFASQPAGTALRWRFETPQGEQVISASVAVLALGGASWPRLGSDGAWQPWLAAQGVALAPLMPANCGFDVQGVGHPHWSAYFSERFAGQPLKSVAVHLVDSQGHSFERKGEFIATATGVEGSLIYAMSALLRDEIAARGNACFHLDLLPHKTPAQVLADVKHPRGSRSLGNHLKSRLGLSGIKLALLHELLTKDQLHSATQLAAAIKRLPITLGAPRPIAEAISSAGGVMQEAMNESLMLHHLPGVFCAGEMLDWEAPTGGYLLTACFASGRKAGEGALQWLAENTAANRDN